MQRRALNFEKHKGNFKAKSNLKGRRAKAQKDHIAGF